MQEIVLVAMGAPGGIGRYEHHLMLALVGMARRGELRAHLLQLADRPRIGVPHLISAGGSRPRLVGIYLATVARHPRATVIFTHVNLAPLALITGLAGVPRRYVVAGYGIDVWYPIRGERRAALRRAWRVLSISSYTSERLVAVQGVQRTRIALLPCAYGLDGTPAAASGPLSGGDPVQEASMGAWASDSGPRLLSVCRLDAHEEQKGIDTTIRALPRLLERWPALSLCVIGRGPDAERLRGIARSLGVERQVEFAGFVPDEELPRAYAACDIFVLPSGKEGFGIVYLEAMAAGRPVVAAAAGGTPDVVIDGQTGLLIPYGNDDALADALMRLLSDPDLRHQLGRAGARRVAEQFSLARFEERLHSALDLPAARGTR